MANQLSGQTGASPREYNNHQRYSKLARLTRSNQGAAFLARVGTKLSQTPAVIFAKITKYGAQRVNAATNISQLP